MLVHWKNSPWVNTLSHSDTLSWFRAKQSVLFLLNSACLEEKQQISSLLSLVWLDRDSYPQSKTRCESMEEKIKTKHIWYNLILHRAMWTIGQCHHVEGKKYWPIIVKYGKLTSLICSPWLTCCSVGHHKKQHYMSLASDPMSWIFNDMINMVYWHIELHVVNKVV